MNLKKNENYCQENLLGPAPRLMKKNLPCRGLTKVEKRCISPCIHRLLCRPILRNSLC